MTLPVRVFRQGDQPLAHAIPRVVFHQILRGRIVHQSLDLHSTGRQTRFFAAVGVVQPGDGIHASKRSRRALRELQAGRPPEIEGCSR